MQEPSLAWRRIRALGLLVALFALTAHLVADGEEGEGRPVVGSETKLFNDWTHWRSYADKDIRRYVPAVFVDGGAPVDIIKRYHYGVQIIRLPTGFTDASMRVVLWDHAKTPTAVFAGPPGFGEMARKDFTAWVSSGRNAVFLGGYESLVAMNELFGFELEYVPFVPGPFWRNDRNTPGTPFEGGPKRLEQSTAVYGVTIDSIPLMGYSMYDTMRVSSVLYIKYNLGTVCYVGASFNGISPRSHWGVALREAIRM